MWCCDAARSGVVQRFFIFCSMLIFFKSNRKICNFNVMKTLNFEFKCFFYKLAFLWNDSDFCKPKWKVYLSCHFEANNVICRCVVLTDVQCMREGIPKRRATNVSDSRNEIPHLTCRGTGNCKYCRSMYSLHANSNWIFVVVTDEKQAYLKNSTKSMLLSSVCQANNY